MRFAGFGLLLLACAHPTPLSAPPPPALPQGTPIPPPTPPAPAPVPVVSGYDKPPQNVLDVLHAPQPPSPYVAPTRDRILLVSYDQYPSITQVAEPFLRLAGVRVEPRTRRKHDTPGGYGVAECARSFTLVEVATSKETPVKLPPGCADDIVWSADGKLAAFANTSNDAVELWILDAITGATHRLGNVRLNPMLGSALQWLPDQRSLLVKIVPDNAGAPPAASVVADGPSIQETTGQKGESSTYETRDTLANKHDEELFDFYARSQLAIIDLAGATTLLGKPAVISDVSGAPDGDHVLVTTIKRPYSYVTTYPNFAHDVEVWSRTTAPVTIAQLPVADRVPVAGVPMGPRDFEWRQTEPSTLIWSEALDKGDWKVTVPNRDKVMMQKAPFTGSPAEITRTEQRYAGLDWSEQQHVALLRDYNENKHWTRTWVIDVDAPAKPKLIWDRSSDDRYNDPGQALHRVLPNGAWVIRQDGDAIFLRGNGSSPAGDRPFLDRYSLTTAKTDRLFRSDPKALEYAIAFADLTEKTFLTWHQSPTDPPNAMLRTLDAPVPGAAAGEATMTSTSRAITHVPDPTPEVRSIKRRLVKYKRADGVDLSFTLITPPGYKEGTKLPAILYAYPQDFASASTAGQVSGSDQRFTQLRDYLLLLLSGYAIIDNAAFPIVGDPKKAYDTYLDQLVADAKAAVDEAVKTGVVDRDRIGVTGHSHGALMTANLIAHTELFKAGAATSGSYNKSLTPFGFQNERRSVWDAQPVYLKVSPFFFADKIKLPLLIVHGQDDANPGTTPLQAVKLYEAIRGNGGTARLVMLPHEPHWYSAMESNEQLAYEELRWFDTYVKNAPAKK